MAKKVDLKKAETRVKGMEEERDQFEHQYRELTNLFIPFRGRYDETEGDKGRRRDHHLLNNAPLLARRVLSAGLMSGVTSPSQKWFQLTTGDQALDQSRRASRWLYEVADIMYRVLAMSNFYTEAQSFYNEISTFGTAVMGVYGDDEYTVRFETQTAGQYALGAGADGKVDSFCLRQKRKVTSIVKEFGLEACPRKVKRMWDNGQLNEEVEFLRLVEPNDDRDKTSPFTFDKPYRSISWIWGTRPSEGPLAIRGFDDFPFMASRWDLAPGDLYGTSCPGMVALGDAKGLQLAEEDLLTAMDHVARPPILASTELRRTMGDQGPRPGKTYYADDVGNATRSLYDQPNINGMAENVSRYEQRIGDAFFKDLFLMLAGSQDETMTATEVIARQEEKMLQVGPVLERMQSELLDPLIDRVFNILQRKGLLPEPPDELVDKDLSVEYLSVLSQAQKLTGVKGLERVSNFAGQLMAIDPRAGLALDVSEILNKYAEAVGVDLDILKSKDEVAQQLQALQQQQQQQTALDSAQQAAETAKDASAAEVGEDRDDVLSRIAQRYGSGQSGPGGDPGFGRDIGGGS